MDSQNQNMDKKKIRKPRRRGGKKGKPRPVMGDLDLHLDSDIEEEDNGWFTRVYIPPPPEGGKQWTVKSIWKKLTDDNGLDVPLGEFRENNDYAA